MRGLNHMKKLDIKTREALEDAKQSAVRFLQRGDFPERTLAVFSMGFMNQDSGSTYLEMTDVKGNSYLAAFPREWLKEFCLRVLDVLDQTPENDGPETMQ
nr:MAG TPA: hypothetical protein [Caudoviricetes sp.]